MEVDMDAEKNIATIKKAIKALNERDMSAVNDLITKNYIRHDLTVNCQGKWDTIEIEVNGHLRGCS